MIHQYFSRIEQLLGDVERSELPAMEAAARKVADCIRTGGIIHLFGCGHSHILTEEVFYRAGGLVPIHPIFHEPLMLHEGAVTSSILERRNDYATTFMKDQQIAPGDVIFVLSTSGRNSVPVDVALLAREKGAFVIVITSPAYAKSQPSRHKSGKYLFEVGDLVINNHSVVGDALLTHEKVAVPFAPSSTVIGAAILQAIFAQTAVLLAECGMEPPLFLSGNIEGADEHNQRMIEAYKERIPLLAR